MIPGSRLLAGITQFAGRFVPLYGLGMGWIVPALIGFAIGMGTHVLKTRRK